MELVFAYRTRWPIGMLPRMSAATPNPFQPDCMSCGRVLTIWQKWRVPAEVDCCIRCWSRVPVAERLKLVIQIRDRNPGGPLNEATELLAKIIEHYSRCS